MTRSLNHLAQTVYIAMSKQEGGGTLLSASTEPCSTSAEGQLHRGRSPPPPEEAAGLTVEGSDSRAGQAGWRFRSGKQVQRNTHDH